MASVKVKEGYIDEEKTELIVDFCLPHRPARRNRVSVLNNQNVLFVEDDLSRPIPITDLINTTLNTVEALGVNNVSMAMPRVGFASDVFEQAEMEEAMLLALLAHSFAGTVTIVVENNRKQVQSLADMLG